MFLVSSQQVFMPSIIPALFKMHLPSLTSIFTEENQVLQNFTVKTILSFIFTLPIITFEYELILSDCNISYERKEIDFSFCKIKKKNFHVFILKINNFCIYTYLTALLVLKVEDLTGRMTATVYYFCSYFYEILYLLECKMRFLPEIWCCNIEVALNSYTKWQARPCRAKPRPASPDQHVRSVLLWDNT